MASKKKGAIHKIRISDHGVGPKENSLVRITVGTEDRKSD